MVDRTADLTARVGLDDTAYKRELRALENTTSRATRGIRQDFERAAKGPDSLAIGIGRVRTAIGALGVIQGARSLARFAVSGREAGQAMERLVSAADRTGLLVEELQELRIAAGQFNIATNTTDTAMQRFTRRLGEAAQGTGVLLPVLDQYGISVTDAEGRTRRTVDVLRDLADATAGAGSQQEQLRIAFQAFDSEGATFVNLLREGGDGLDRFLALARGSGAIIEGGVARSVAALNSQLELMDARLAASSTRLRAAWLPTLIASTDALADFGEALTRIVDPLLPAAVRSTDALEAQLSDLIARERELAAGGGFLTLGGDLSALEATRRQIERINTELARRNALVARTPPAAVSPVPPPAATSAGPPIPSPRPSRARPSVPLVRRSAAPFRVVPDDTLARELADARVEAFRLERRLDTMASAGAGAFGTLISGSRDFRGALASVEQQLIAMITQLAIVEPLTAAFRGALSAQFGPAGSIASSVVNNVSLSLPAAASGTPSRDFRPTAKMAAREIGRTLGRIT